MRLLKFNEVEKIKKENPAFAKKAFFRASLIGATVSLIVVVIAPIVEENALFVSLVFGASIFAASFNSFLQEKPEIEVVKNEQNN